MFYCIAHTLLGPGAQKTLQTPPYDTTELLALLEKTYSNKTGDGD